MKPYIFFDICIFSFCLIPVRAQERADFFRFAEDAQWYYEIADDGMGSGGGCIRMSVAGDTLLEGRKCQRIKIESCDRTYETLYEYLYPCGEKLYYYNFQTREFFMLLDFSAQAGDTVWVHTNAFTPNLGFDPYQRWKLYDTDYFSFMAYRITAVDTVSMGNKSFKRQSAQPITIRNTEHGEEHSEWMFPGWHHDYIIEGIGSLGGFFGEVWGLYPEWGKCRLCCFSANGQNYISDGECGSASTERMQVQEKEIWRLSPQPATNVVRATCMSDVDKNWRSGHWRLFNLTGKIIQHGTFVDEGFEITLRDNPTGMYMLEIDNGKGSVSRLKCLSVKQ